MGCAQSKLENEETVARCRNRKRYMKEAVAARNAFAAAHSSYAVALKHTGAALSEYGQGELGPLPSPSPPQTAIPHQPTIRPPPRPDDFSPPPLQRSLSMPDLPAPKPSRKAPPGANPPIAEEEDEEPSSPGNAGEHIPSPSPSPSPAAPAPPPLSPKAPPAPPPPREERPPTPEGISTWDYFFQPDERIPAPSLAGDSAPSPAQEEPPPPPPPQQQQQQHYERAVNSAPNPGAVEAAAAEVKREEQEDEEEESAQQRLVRKKPVGAGGEGKHHQRTGSTGGGGGSGKGKAVGHVTASVNLVQMLFEADDHFLKASESAQEVTKMLESTRLHYHSNFADNRGHIDHSARVMKVITWNRSFKGLPDADDGKDDFDDEEWETHATILDKLLAWEKKLYDEVKAGEVMKVEYQKKVARLEKLKKRNTSNEALEKTRAAVSHMQTRCIVDMQSMDSTVSEIQRLRDEQLYVKLSALVDGMANMWESMHKHHEFQQRIVGDLRALDISSTPKETTPQHYTRTEQLYRISNDWHTHFNNLMKHQKDYVAALGNWLKFNVIPIESNLREKVSSPPRIQRPPLQALVHSWLEQMERLPYDLAESAISGFTAVIKSVMDQQQEELKQKQQCEEMNKELKRKERAFNEWRAKHVPSGVPSQEADPEQDGDGSQQKDLVAEKSQVVDLARQHLQQEEEELRRKCKQVREKAVGSLKSHLPELFRAMTDFSLACSDMCKYLRNTVKQSQAGPGA